MKNRKRKGQVSNKINEFWRKAQIMNKYISASLHE